MKSFANKVAAITGAGSGIGQALALELAKQGCHLALSDLNEEGLAQTIAQLSSFSVKVTQHKLDVADQKAVFKWAQQVKNEHGQVNMIFNNAGIAMANTVEGHQIADYEKMMGVNYWGVVYGTKAFLPYINETRDGHIINISSLFGLTSQPSQSAYNSSKFAVRGFTESLRQELDLMKAGVSATCVHPGGIRTNINKNVNLGSQLRTIGMNPDKSAKQFDKFLRIPAKDAANIILNGVLKDKRRVLIGVEAYAVDILQRIFPASYQRVLGAVIKLGQR